MTISFESFVEESLPGLLRFGQVLTGDPEASRDLVRRALAGTPRRRIRTATDPDAQIRQAMAREYATWSVGADVEPNRTDPVGGALATLSPGQRAVTILRYGEGLSDADVAHALGVKIPKAKNDMSSALSRMRATFPEGQRPDAVDLGRRLRDHVRSIDVDVPSGDLTVAQVRRAAGRVRLRRMALAVGGAVSAGALVAGAVFLVANGDDDARVAGTAPTPHPSPTTLGGLGEVSIEGMDELTPDDFEGLAIGMTVADVEAAFGDRAEFRDQVPGTGCEVQVDIGGELTGWFDQWPLSDDGEPAPDADLILTEVAYYGEDATTLAGIAVGMLMEDARTLSGMETVPTPVGDAIHTAYTPRNASGQGGVVGGIGYRAWPPPRCGPGLILDPEEYETTG